MKFDGKIGNGPMNKWLNFGGDIELIRHTGKTCFGGGMHCPSASSITWNEIAVHELATSYVSQSAVEARSAAEATTYRKSAK